jgi:SAM-dependent methyltransferase
MRLGPKASSRELRVGSHAHFEDAAYYTATYRNRKADVVYYAELAVREGTRVLEYGCGNGRIAVPLARSGIEVTGVDHSAPMLADLRRRLRSEPPTVRERVTLRRGDMRSVRLGRRFGLVLCTFNTFLHLYGRRDVERFLARVREHLAPGGRFVLDVSIPDPAELLRPPDRLYRVPRFRHPSTGEVVRYGERFDYDPLGQILYVSMEFEPLRGREPAWTTPLAHRQFFPQELEALLHYNGFEIVELHGDHLEEPPRRDCSTLIVHCRARRRTRRR